MELLEVLDINGNKTGEVLDRETIHKNNILHYEVFCMIINDKKEVLLQKRSANKKHNPNIYAITAGHVTSGENLKGAMARELKEELSIDVNENDLKEYADRKIKIRGKNSNVSVYYYITCNMDTKDFIVQKEELSEVKWFKVNEIVDMIKNKDPKVVWGEDAIPFFEIVNSIDI